MNIQKIMILQKLTFSEAKTAAENISKKTDNCTYASISSLTTQIDELKAEIEKLKTQNLKFLQRSHSAETILKEYASDITNIEKKTYQMPLQTLISQI